MNFESKITHESRTVPGVRFIVRRLNVVQRAKRDAPLLQQRVRMSEIDERLKKLPPVPEATEGEESHDPYAIDRASLNAESRDLENLHYRPAYIRAGLVSIEGVEIDGKTPNADALIESGPDDLITEIYIACIEASGLSAVAQGNSQSPSTSQNPADGGASNTTASNASATDTTSIAIAASTSQKT